jgi:hypothetical protein
MLISISELPLKVVGNGKLGKGGGSSANPPMG